MNNEGAAQMNGKFSITLDKQTLDIDELRNLGPEDIKGLRADKQKKSWNRETWAMGTAMAFFFSTCFLTPKSGCGCGGGQPAEPQPVVQKAPEQDVGWGSVALSFSGLLAAGGSYILINRRKKRFDREADMLDQAVVMITEDESVSRRPAHTMQQLQKAGYVTYELSAYSFDDDEDPFDVTLNGETVGLDQLQQMNPDKLAQARDSHHRKGPFYGVNFFAHEVAQHHPEMDSSFWILMGAGGLVLTGAMYKCVSLSVKTEGRQRKKALELDKAIVMASDDPSRARYKGTMYNLMNNGFADPTFHDMAQRVQPV